MIILFLNIRVANISIIADIAFTHINDTIPSRFRTTRFDPDDFAPEDLESVRDFTDYLRSETRPPALVDEQNNRKELPRPIYDLLVRVATALQEGKVISLVPETQELTTQAAANLLGVSRPHLVKLLESGELPFHKVGAHRRVRMKDLMEFQRIRDKNRREALDEMARRIEEAGLY